MSFFFDIFEKFVTNIKENAIALNKIPHFLDEKKLIEDLKAQKSVAFDTLYTKYASILYGIILQIVQHHSIAQQILEQVFINIWNNIEQYNATNSNFLAWMRDISHTLAHNSKRNIIEDEQNANLDKISSNHLKKNEKNQNLQTPFLVSQEQDADKKISHKIIIDLIYFRGYSVETIAKEFNLSVENTKNIVKIALNQLKENSKQKVSEN